MGEGKCKEHQNLQKNGAFNKLQYQNGAGKERFSEQNKMDRENRGEFQMMRNRQKIIGGEKDETVNM
jgi:hypothetical protein